MKLFASKFLFVFGIFIFQKSFSQDAITFYNQGNAYFNQEKFDLAINSYTSALKKNPQLTEAYCNRGFTYFTQRKYIPAIADFDSAIKINPAGEI